MLTLIAFLLAILVLAIPAARAILAALIVLVLWLVACGALILWLRSL